MFPENILCPKAAEALASTQPKGPGVFVDVEDGVGLLTEVRVAVGEAVGVKDAVKVLVKVGVAVGEAVGVTVKEMVGVPDKEGVEATGTELMEVAVVVAATEEVDV